MKRRPRLVLGSALGLSAMLVLGGGKAKDSDQPHWPDSTERIEAGGPYTEVGAWIGPDQRTVLISTTGGACDKQINVRVHEGADTVKIAITVRVAGGMCIQPAFFRGYRVVLHEPLGSRKLLAIDDVAYPRITIRPRESSSAGDRQVPVKVEFD